MDRLRNGRLSSKEINDTRPFPYVALPAQNSPAYDLAYGINGVYSSLSVLRNIAIRKPGGSAKELLGVLINVDGVLGVTEHYNGIVDASIDQILGKTPVAQRDRTEDPETLEFLNYISSETTALPLVVPKGARLSSEQLVIRGITTGITTKGIVHTLKSCQSMFMDSLDRARDENRPPETGPVYSKFERTIGVAIDAYNNDFPKEKLPITELWAMFEEAAKETNIKVESHLPDNVRPMHVWWNRLWAGMTIQELFSNLKKKAVQEIDLSAFVSVPDNQIGIVTIDDGEPVHRDIIKNGLIPGQTRFPEDGIPGSGWGTSFQNQVLENHFGGSITLFNPGRGGAGTIVSLPADS